MRALNVPILFGLVGLMGISGVGIAADSQKLPTGVYFKPALELANGLQTGSPKCFYKYLVSEIGYNTRKWQVSAELNWLDYVDVLTAYRVAFPYVFVGKYLLHSGDEAKLTLLMTNPTSLPSKPSVEDRKVAQLAYSHKLPSVLGWNAELAVSANTAVDGVHNVSGDAGFRLSRHFGAMEGYVSFNGLGLKEKMMIAKGKQIVTLGTNWKLHDDSRLSLSLNRVLGQKSQEAPSMWLDLNFNFGAFVSSAN